jgi:flagellar hook protein FlgE
MNSQNEAIQGWVAVNGKINTNAQLANIVVPTGTLEPAVATANMSLNMNLDASAPVVAAPLTAANASYSTQIQIFDSLGEPQNLTLNFWKTASASSGPPATPATWQWATSTPNGTTTSSGNLSFDQQGNLVSPAPTAAAPTITISGLSDGAANMTFNFNLYANGAAAVTQYAQQSATSSNTQDGSAPASVTGVSIGSGGAVMASLSNGKQLQVGELAVANFVNPTSLIAVGNNDYQVSGLTSQPAIGAAGTGGRGDVVGSTLESSTVDISTEFTRLMTFQNSYSANSRVITTANSMEQETVNLIHP